MMLENQNYVKRGVTSAKALDGPLVWEDKFKGDGTMVTSDQGDMRVDEGGGNFYVVDKETFHLTYEPVPGSEGQYVKRPVRARMLTEDQSVMTNSGLKNAQAGDILVTGVKGESYVMTKAKFDELYDRAADQPDRSEAFTMPKITGEAVVQKDGTTVIPTEGGGRIVFDEKNKRPIHIRQGRKRTGRTLS